MGVLIDDEEKRCFMSSCKMGNFLFIVLFFGSISVQAESGEGRSVYTEYYGLVDAVYPEKSHVVLGDVGLNYTHGTSFFKSNGKRFSDISNVLVLGTPVKYQYIEQPPSLVLRELRVISIQEFERSRKLNIDR